MLSYRIIFIHCLFIAGRPLIEAKGGALLYNENEENIRLENEPQISDTEDLPKMFSRKVFIGGLPPDITEG